MSSFGVGIPLWRINLCCELYPTSLEATICCFLMEKDTLPSFILIQKSFAYFSFDLFSCPQLRACCHNVFGNIGVINQLTSILFVITRAHRLVFDSCLLRKHSLHSLTLLNFKYRFLTVYNLKLIHK